MAWQMFGAKPLIKPTYCQLDPEEHTAVRFGQERKFAIQGNEFETSVRKIAFYARPGESPHKHYNDVIMGGIASQITSLTIVYSTVYSEADQIKHQSSASLAFVRGIHRGPVNSPHRWPVTRKMFPFDDVIME